MQLTAERHLDSVPTLNLPTGYELAGLFVADGTQEVLVVSTGSVPTVTEARKIHHDRDAKRNAVLVVAIEGPNGAYIIGPIPAGALAGPLPADQAQRVLQAGLDEQSALAARKRLTHLLSAIATNADLAGVTNSGLFASHYLATSARERSDWGEQAAAAQPLLTLRSSELIGRSDRAEGLFVLEPELCDAVIGRLAAPVSAGARVRLRVAK